MLALGGDDPARLGPYRLRAVIGDGGMGRVYLGTSPGGRAVAVKVIGSGLANQPNYRERFAREARAAMAVSGLYTASVVDADTTGERPYLATEYVPAPSLAEAVRAAGPMPTATVSALAGGLAEALAAIHRAGLVHRDVKPANILLAPDGPVVIDFGIALGTDAGLTSLTAVGMAVGSPGYIAPEVLTGGEPTPAADMFALACVLVYAARGVGPFGKGEPLVVAHRTVSAEPDLAGLPDFVRTLTLPLLARDPSARPTPAQLLEHLSIASREAVLHDALWLPEGVRTLLNQRRLEVQRVLAGGAEQAGATGPVGARPAVAPPPPYVASGPVSSLPPPVPPRASPAPPASHKVRYALLSILGVAAVAGVTAALVVLAHNKDNGSGNASGSQSPTGHARAAGSVTTVTSPASSPSSSPSTAATSASASAPASGVLGYKPGTYPVDKLVATDSLGYASVYLADVRVYADGTVRVDLQYTNDTDSTQEFECLDVSPNEGQLAIGDASVASDATSCSDDPLLDENVPPNSSISGYEKFPSAPAGSGAWTYSIANVEFNGSVSGIVIPTQ